MYFCFVEFFVVLPFLAFFRILQKVKIVCRFSTSRQVTLQTLVNYTFWVLFYKSVHRFFIFNSMTLNRNEHENRDLGASFEVFFSICGKICSVFKTSDHGAIVAFPFTSTVGNFFQRHNYQFNTLLG